MNKLEQLEKKYQELGAEIERLKRPKTGKVLKPSDLSKGDIYYYVSTGVLPIQLNCDILDCARIKAGVAFHDEQSANNYRDARLLAHECDIAIAESWDGEEIDWNDENQSKFCFTLSRNNILVTHNEAVYKKFAFKECKQALAFIDKHGEEAVKNMLRNY